MVSVALGFAYSLVNAAGRPSLMATLAEMPSELRGVLFGLNITMASIGWLMAGSVGAGLIATGGYTGLGVFCSVVAAIGCGLGLASVTKVREKAGEGREGKVREATTSQEQHG
jgi:DHA1 family inner membrane transport protein